MFKKRWKIFRWSVPAWLVIACLFTTVIAVAAFLTALTGVINITASGGVNVAFSDHTCTIQNGMGQIDTCTLTDGNLLYEASGLDDESALRFNVHVTNNDSMSAFLYLTVPLAEDIDGVSQIDVNVGTGYELIAGNAIDLTMYIYLADLQPFQAVDPLNFQFAFSDLVP